MAWKHSGSYRYSIVNCNCGRATIAARICALTSFSERVLSITVLLMAGATTLIGLLPTYASIGVAAPVVLIALRMLQGLALGGEYGGAATYVAEHAPHGARGAYTSWIQTTATLGLFLSLVVILGTRTLMGEAEFGDWGWRIPFLVSILLLGVSVWIRLSLSESPAFQKMKAEGKTSRAPLSESFGQWKNLKIVILALIGLTAGQAVVWYTGQFYALFFLTQQLKVDAVTANLLIAAALLIGTPFFVVFGTLSDRIGRKPIIMLGCVLAVLTYFPAFKALADNRCRNIKPRGFRQIDDPGGTAVQLFGVVR